MNKIFKAFLLLICAMMVTVVTGCTNNNETNEVINEIKKEDIYVIIYDAEEDDNIEKEVVVETDKKDEEKFVNDVIENYKKEYASIRSSEDEEKMSEYYNELPVMNAKLNDDIVEITFDKVLENMGSGTEGAFIRNLVDTLKRNLTKIKGVTINVNGEPYASGHLMFEVDEIIK